MENKLVKCGKLSISNNSPFTLIAGPCQLENEKHAIDVAEKLKEITAKLKIGFISADFGNHPGGYFTLSTLRELRKKAFYIKPSDIRRVEKEKTMRRVIRLSR
mgnify:CR=1 FL=1